MDFNVGDRVQITRNSEALPPRQQQYAGLMGTVKLVDGKFIHVSPDTSLYSEDNCDGWIAFYPLQLNLLGKKLAQ